MGQNIQKFRVISRCLFIVLAEAPSTAGTSPFFSEDSTSFSFPYKQMLLFHIALILTAEHTGNPKNVFFKNNLDVVMFPANIKNF